jgi:23S rRNA pseudouridine2605 synthase
MNEDKHKGERIAKIMARAGLCSRRDAEKWVAQGRVKVNGKEIDSPALNITAADKVVVDGKALPEKQNTQLFLYHKPPGLVTSHSDEQGRSTVFDNLPDDLPRVISVGRLDLNTEGLLLLTNDGELARFLELPATGWQRRYRVRVNGKVSEKRLESLKNGITVEGVRYKSIEAKLESIPEDERQINAGANSWISVSIREGKNREIRRVMEALGLRVTRLIRTDYGPFSLGKMQRGTVVEVKTDVMKYQIAKFFGDYKGDAPKTPETPKVSVVRKKPRQKLGDFKKDYFEKDNNKKSRPKKGAFQKKRGKDENRSR